MRKRNLIYIFFYFIGIIHLNAQNVQFSKKFNSKYEKQIKSDFILLNNLLSSDIEKSLVLTEKMIKQAKENSDICNVAILYTSKSLAFSLSSNYEKARLMIDSALVIEKKCPLKDNLKFRIANAKFYINSDIGSESDMQKDLKECLFYAEKLKDTSKIIATLGNFSYFYNSFGKKSQSLKYLEQAIKYCDPKKDSTFISKIYMNMGAYYLYAKNYQKVITLSNLGLRVTIDKFHNSKAGLNNNKAQAYMYLNKLDSAENIIIYSLNNHIEPSNKFSRSYAYHTLASIYFKSNKLNNALDWFTKEEMLNDSIGFIKEQINCFRAKAETYVQLNQIENGQKYIKKADSLLLKANVIDEKYLLVNTKVKAFLSETNRDLLYEFIASEKIRDSLISEGEKVLTQDLIEKYESEQKELKNQELLNLQKIDKLKISNQKWTIVLVSFGLLIISILSFFLYKKKNIQKELADEALKNKDQIQLLNKELNHRVKNNLAFMKSLLEMQSRRTSNEETKTLLKESETRLNALALVHTRLFADQDNVTTVDLYDYLTEITKYLSDVYQLPDRQLIIQSGYIHHQMDAEDAMRLGLIVNELITNSIKHAFIEIAEPTIHIKTYKNSNSQLVLSYMDNGHTTIPIAFHDNETPTHSASLGLKLIGLLREQLENKVYVQIL
jgi:two-component system, sensor histidine kinase PdtaS